MKRIDKAGRIGRLLDEVYPALPIPLRHHDPFTLLVAVLLSAQTTDKKVNEVTPALFGEAPDPAAMAALGSERILEHIRVLGLAPTKAKHVAALSELLLSRHGGEVPADMEALEALPGVGHKTASVVMAQAFGVPAFPVDTHIHRLATRWGLTSGKNVKQTEADCKDVFPRETWIRRHLQIVQFGRDTCPARWHDLSTCPVCGWAASKKRVAEEAKHNASRRRKR
ncbi:MAG TPA: endonuclease III [Myxococcota bacterium]|nr:endonuclease III [Myxococcota bacterium]